MIRNTITPYHSLPIMDIDSPELLGKDIVLYQDLIIDVSGFRHPGSNKVIQNFKMKNIYIVFNERGHSPNAELMLLNLAIGRLSVNSQLGAQFYERVSHSKMVQLHEQVIQSLDFKHGLLNQLRKLSPEQIEAFITIPKYFSNTDHIKFKDGKWQQMWYRDNFWVSAATFITILLLCISYLFTNSSLFATNLQVMLFVLGIIKWTAIQYYFHRFVLHLDISKNDRILNGHYLHHAFPNLKNKLALSVTRNVGYQILIFLGYTQILRLNYYDTLHIMMGMHFFMVLYDCLHYYFHFGPDLNIPIISGLKKNHMKHHYRDKDNGFGVTNTFWDRLFGSTLNV